MFTAVDKVRRQEHKALSAKHDETLKGTKYLWLRNPENFTDEAWKSFKILRESSLKSAKAWAMKETIMNLWKYSYVGSATKFFKDWYGWVMHSRLEPMKEAARLLARRLDNILTYLKHHLTNAVTESINSKIQWIKYTARGFRNRENYKTAILFHCGGLNLYPL